MHNNLFCALYNESVQIATEKQQLFNNHTINFYTWKQEEQSLPETDQIRLIGPSNRKNASLPASKAIVRRSCI